MKIEKGIAFEGRRERGAMKRWTDNFAAMEVGDSFAYPSDAKHSVRVAIFRYRKSGGAGRFSYAKQDVGYRCWRTA